MWNGMFLLIFQWKNGSPLKDSYILNKITNIKFDLQDSISQKYAQQLKSWIHSNIKKPANTGAHYLHFVSCSLTSLDQSSLTVSNDVVQQDQIQQQWKESTRLLRPFLHNISFEASDDIFM